MKLYKTTEQLISENYPYGFRLKTTKTDYLEFDKKRGFRHCSVTINPKNGLQNKPKKSTYYDIMVLGKDEINHTKSLVMHFYDQKDINKIVEFFSNQDNYDLFTSDQIEYIYMRFLVYIKVSIGSQATYCGSKVEDLMPLYDEQMKLLVKGIKEKTNVFGQITFDWEKINSLKVEGYNPFRVTTYGA